MEGWSILSGLGPAACFLLIGGRDPPESLPKSLYTFRYGDHNILDQTMVSISAVSLEDRKTDEETTVSLGVRKTDCDRQNDYCVRVMTDSWVVSSGGLSPVIVSVPAAGRCF
jgi:hypothetical protein